jgi:hypothetical protein
MASYSKLEVLVKFIPTILFTIAHLYTSEYVVEFVVKFVVEINLE